MFEDKERDMRKMLLETLVSEMDKQDLQRIPASMQPMEDQAIAQSDKGDVLKDPSLKVAAIAPIDESQEDPAEEASETPQEESDEDEEQKPKFKSRAGANLLNQMK